MAPKSKSTTVSEDEPLTTSAIGKLLEKHLQPLKSKLDDLGAAVARFEARLALLETEQKEHANTLTFMGDEIMDMRSQLASTEERLRALDSGAGREVIERMEHERRARSVELFGVPYAAGENLMEVIPRLSAKLKLKTVPDNIDLIYRIKTSKRVVIRFVQKHRRDEFMSEYKKTEINLQDLGFKDNSRVYINEVLSKGQYELLFKARNFKKANNFKYIWTKNQKIYLRKAQDSEAVEVTSEKVLANLCKQ